MICNQTKDGWELFYRVDTYRVAQAKFASDAELPGILHETPVTRRQWTLEASYQHSGASSCGASPDGRARRRLRTMDMFRRRTNW